MKYLMSLPERRPRFSMNLTGTGAVDPKPMFERARREHDERNFSGALPGGCYFAFFRVWLDLRGRHGRLHLAPGAGS